MNTKGKKQVEGPILRPKVSPEQIRAALGWRWEEEEGRLVNAVTGARIEARPGTVNHQPMIVLVTPEGERVLERFITDAEAQKRLMEWVMFICS